LTVLRAVYTIASKTREVNPVERTPRAIRLNDAEWEIFKSLLGAPWLRDQIAKARKRAAREQEKSK